MGRFRRFWEEGGRCRRFGWLCRLWEKCKAVWRKRRGLEVWRVVEVFGRVRRGVEE